MNYRMEKHKRLQDYFKWIPSKNTENRMPLYFMVEECNPENPRIDDIFFVNNSGEALKTVISGSGGFETLDDTVLPMEGPEFHYVNVQSGEAVKIETFVNGYDSDYIIQYDVHIVTANGERKAFRYVNKGSVDEVVLQWDNNDLGKNVRLVLSESKFNG